MSKRVACRPPPPPSSPPGAREAGTGGTCGGAMFPVWFWVFFWWWGIKRGVVGAFDGVFFEGLGKRKLRNGEERHGAGLLAQVRCGVAWRGFGGRVYAAV